MLDELGEGFGLDDGFYFVFASIAVVEDGPAAAGQNLLVTHPATRDHSAKHGYGSLNQLIPRQRTTPT